jgi:hypothetical protein
MVKIDAIWSKKDAIWSKRTRYGQNRRNMVKKELIMVKNKVSNKCMNIQMNIAPYVI